MKSIYLSHFVLEVPSSKNELCSAQLIRLKEAFMKSQIDYVAVLWILAKPAKNLRCWFWCLYEYKFRPWFYHSLIGAMLVWLLHHFFKKDIIVTELKAEMIEPQLTELCEFLNKKDEVLKVKPILKVGLFQHLTNVGFDDITVEQFIEAHRCLSMIENAATDSQKERLINELLSYLFAPRWMWFLGMYGRLFFLKESFRISRQKKLTRLPEAIRILLYQYYLDNLALMKKWYRNFYEEPKKNKDDKPRDVYTQYFSMKSLIQLRSENGTLADKVKMMPIRDLIESYEVEIIQSKIKMEKNDSSGI